MNVDSRGKIVGERSCSKICVSNFKFKFLITQKIARALPKEAGNVKASLIQIKQRRQMYSNSKRGSRNEKRGMYMYTSMSSKGDREGKGFRLLKLASPSRSRLSDLVYLKLKRPECSRTKDFRNV